MDPFTSVVIISLDYDCVYVFVIHIGGICKHATDHMIIRKMLRCKPFIVKLYKYSWKSL